MITAGQSKAARNQLGLTQKQVSTSVGICNTDISKFECGRSNLHPKDLSNLEAFYEEQKAIKAREASLIDADTPTVTISGFEVPSNLDQDKVEFLKTSYDENQELIEEVLDTEVDRSFFSGINQTSLIRDLLVPIAENLVIIQTILGSSKINIGTSVSSLNINEDESVKTYRDALEHMISTPYTPE